jgi:Restriction Endonuclease associating with ARP
MPQPPTPSRPEIWSASLLRRDLSARAHHIARTQNLLHDISPGSSPVVIFGRDEQGRHGNFHPASDINICANPAWLRRLTKPHTASRRSRARKDWQWRELDSANSSDALLMNIFCHPGVFNGHTIAPAVANLLNIDPATQPCFGINPRVPLKHLRKRRATQKPQTDPNSSLNKNSNTGATNNPGAPKPALSSPKGLDSETWVLEAETAPSPAPTDQTLTDRTEIDLQLGNLFLEAKLTESNFQTATPRLIERYRDLETIFDLTRLPRKDTGVIQGYQLIRNVLAAYASDAGFCVLCDTRRRDLIEIWYSVLSAVHSYTFATRLKLLTWQELSTTLPQDLQQFLEAKYGIVPA